MRGFTPRGFTLCGFTLCGFTLRGGVWLRTTLRTAELVVPGRLRALMRLKAGPRGHAGRVAYRRCDLGAASLN